jgi:hypothetical protein
LQNLLDEKKKDDHLNLEKVFEKQKREENKKSLLKQKNNELIKIMNKYDIHHPLRGEKY